jgi:beta-lactamase regulating signal transducer with metallopeptidase domain
MIGLATAVVWAWVVLAVLAGWVRLARRNEPRSRCWLILWALGLPLVSAGALFARPHTASVISIAPFSGAGAVFRAAGAAGPSSWFPIAAWGVGTVWIAALGVGAVTFARHVTRQAVSIRRAEACPGPIYERVRLLANRAEVPLPRVLLSREAQIPFVAGIFDRTLIVPERLCDALDANAFTLMIRHELEHLRAGDQIQVLWAMLTSLAFTGHPLATWLKRELAVAREEAVDATVGQEDRHAYARLLVDVAELQHFGAFGLETAAMSGTALQRRITMLEETLRRPAARLTGIVSTAVCLCGLALFAPGAWAEPGMPPGASKGTDINLSPGQEKVLDIKGLERVAVGDPKIADVHLGVKATEVVLSGVHDGQTTLVLWTSDGKRLSYELVVAR